MLEELLTLGSFVSQGILYLFIYRAFFVIVLYGRGRPAPSLFKGKLNY